MNAIMRYLGSKALLLHKIKELLIPYDQGMIFCDPFGGIGTVGKHMKQSGFKVISGDLLQFAHFFQVALIKMNSIPNFSSAMFNLGKVMDLENYLNSLRVNQGWLIEEYSHKRQFFTLDNAQRIQACVDTIWEWNKKNKLSYDEYAFLIASLIQSMDRVANTAGTYYAYLKTFYRKARQTFQFKFLQPVNGNEKCQCFLKDANEFVREHSCNVLYLDPPYNTRDYSRYYHLPESIAKGKIPIATGKSGVPKQKSIRSPFVVKSKVEAAFADIIQQAKCETIIFHYTDKGLLSNQFIRDVLYNHNKVEEYYFDCKGYNTKETASINQHHIYKVIK